MNNEDAATLRTSILHQIDSIEEQLQKLKKEIKEHTDSIIIGRHGDDDDDDDDDNVDIQNIATASAVLSKTGRDLRDLTDSLFNNANDTAKETFDDLVTLLSDLYHEEEDGEEEPDIFWNSFNNKLKSIEANSNDDFKAICFGRFYHVGGDSNCKITILHLACLTKPPVEVMRTLLDIVPNGFDHLCCGSITYFPLHTVLMNGGSVEIVKLLVKKDEELVSLKKITNHGYEFFDMLIENKAKYSPNNFTAILTFLVQTTIDRLSPEEFKLILQKCPLRDLFQELGRHQHDDAQDHDEDADVKSILNDKDFILLVKATCYYQVKAYHRISLHENGDDGKSVKNEDGDSKDYSNNDIIDGLGGGIDDIPFFYAFLICYPYMYWHWESSDSFKDKVFAKLLAKSDENKQILLDNGTGPLFANRDGRQVPIIFNILFSPRYMASPCDCPFVWGDDFLPVAKLIFNNVPEVARLTNENGLHPLHIAADRCLLREIKDRHRYDLVQILWNAYPEALDVMEKETGLPLFVMSILGEDDGFDGSYGEDDESLSTSYFLLRQHPEVLNVTINAAGDKRKEKEVERSTKRFRQK